MLQYDTRTLLAQRILQNCDENGTVCCKNKELAEYLGVTPRHISRLITELEQEGVLSREGADGCGLRTGGCCVMRENWSKREQRRTRTRFSVRRYFFRKALVKKMKVIKKIADVFLEFNIEYRHMSCLLTAFSSMMITKTG